VFLVPLGRIPPSRVPALSTEILSEGAIFSPPPPEEPAFLGGVSLHHFGYSDPLPPLFACCPLEYTPFRRNQDAASCTLTLSPLATLYRKPFPFPPFPSTFWRNPQFFGRQSRFPPFLSCWFLRRLWGGRNVTFSGRSPHGRRCLEISCYFLPLFRPPACLPVDLFPYFPAGRLVYLVRILVPNPRPPKDVLPTLPSGPWSPFFFSLWKDSPEEIPLPKWFPPKDFRIPLKSLFFLSVRPPTQKFLFFCRNLFHDYASKSSFFPSTIPAAPAPLPDWRISGFGRE